MEAELAPPSRWSDKVWELREGGEVRARLVRTSWWGRRWRAEAGGDGWEIRRSGRWGRGLVASDGAARYVPQRHNRDVIELADGRVLGFARPGRFRSARVLSDGDHELATLKPRGWRRGIDLELGAGGVREPGLALPLLLACAVLLAERQDEEAAAGGAAAASAGGG